MPPGERALVLTRTVAERQLVVRACAAARQAGVRPGLSLAQARALCPGLAHAADDPGRDAKGLEALGRWMTRFTPVVQCGAGDEDSAAAVEGVHALFLDLTGTGRLFGPPGELLARIGAALEQMGIRARIAAAPTPGAAWALTYAAGPRTAGGMGNGTPLPVAGRAMASFARESHGQASTLAHATQNHRYPVVTAPDELPAALDALPPVALRLGDDALAKLHHLGLSTVGQVLKLPRALLPARFGAGLLLRIDQALGRVAEPLAPLPFQPAIDAWVDFDGVVDSLEVLWLHFKELIARVVEQLTRRGHGARRLALTFCRPYAPAVDKTVDLSAPSRDAGTLFNLVRCAMETIGEGKATKRRTGERANGRRAHVFKLRRTGEPAARRYETFAPAGFTGLRLSVPVSQRLTDEQVALLEQDAAIGRRDLDRLVERLRIRLGDEGLVGVRAVESHVPERAYGVGADGVQGSGFRVQQKKRKKSVVARTRARGSHYLIGDRQSAMAPLLAPPEPRTRSPEPSFRPLHLLPTPKEISVIVRPSDDRDGAPVAFVYDGRQRRIVHAVGPERIGGAWWLGRDKTRDYFDVEDDAGRRWWVFRVFQTSRWFLHGGFE
jgi:protein ImuB